MRCDLGRRQIAVLRVCASPQRVPASAKGSVTVRGCMTLVLRSVSHGNRDCRAEPQEHHKPLHTWHCPDLRVSRFVTGVLP